MKKYLRLTEYSWLFLAIICIGITTYFFIIHDTDSGSIGLMLTLFAGIMYNMRRMFNRRMERMAKKQEEEQQKQ
ncbi:MAG TPA: hypothetical protein VFU15_10890 [Bacteroidia bacterium]|nr:hypothetical protein [Bacteroidia bacterium]